MNREIAELQEVIGKLVPMLTGKGLKVTQRGVRAYVETDPKTNAPTRVNIPCISDNATPEFIRALRGFIDHEVAHVLISDFKALNGAVNKLGPKTNRAKAFHSVLNMVEDTMIEREIVKIFPGSARNLNEIREYFCAEITKPALKNAKNENEEFLYLLVPVLRALAGQSEFENFLDENDLWKHRLVDAFVTSVKAQPGLMDALRKAKSTADTIAIATQLDTILHQPQEEDESEGDGDEKGDKSKSSKKPGKGKSSGDVDSDCSGEGGEATGKGNSKDESEGKSGKSKETTGEGEDDEGGSSGKEDESEKEDEGKSGAGDPDGEDDEDGEEDGGAGKDKDEDGDDDGDSDVDGDDDDDDADDGDDEGADDGDDGDSDDDEDELEREAQVSREADPGAEGDDSERQGGEEGTGVGTAPGKAMFDMDPSKLDALDLSGAMAAKISELAAEVVASSDYTPYTRDFDRIEVLKVDSKFDPKWVVKLEDTVQSMVGRMQKDVERMMASQNYVIRTPGHKSGKLHGPSLMRVTQGDPRVFSRREETKSANTAVTLLVDNSGSMGGSKTRLAMQAAYALMQTLDRVKIPCEVLGFTTGESVGYGRGGSALGNEIAEDQKIMSGRKGGGRYHSHFDRFETIVMPIYKSFNERVTVDVKKRVAFMENCQPGLNGNIDGESLLYAAARLVQRTERRKVMIVFSDGQPAGGGRSGPHLKFVAKDLQKSGIECIGIGIMSDAVRSYYDKNVVLKDINALPGEVMGQIKALLA